MLLASWGLEENTKNRIVWDMYMKFKPIWELHIRFYCKFGGNVISDGWVSYK